MQGRYCEAVNDAGRAKRVGESKAGFTEFPHSNLLRIFYHEAKMLALPNSEIMIHQPLGGMQGQATDIKIHADRIIRMRQTLNEILARETGKSIEEIARDTERDNFMTAKEAAEYGLIDKVIEKRA